MKSYVPSPRQTARANKYHAYTNGWRDGAATRAMSVPSDSKHKLAPLYHRGYADGIKARGQAFKRAQKCFHYEPSILRVGNPKLQGPQ